jgi:hypothetical protein
MASTIVMNDVQKARKVKILAAAHAFTEEMNALGVKYATVVYDESVQEDGGGLKLYSLGNVEQVLIDWILNLYVEMRGSSEIVDLIHIKSDPDKVAA